VPLRRAVVPRGVDRREGDTSLDDVVAADVLLELVEALVEALGARHDVGDVHLARDPLAVPRALESDESEVEEVDEASHVGLARVAVDESRQRRRAVDEVNNAAAAKELGQRPERARCEPELALRDERLLLVRHAGKERLPIPKPPPPPSCGLVATDKDTLCYLARYPDLQAFYCGSSYPLCSSVALNDARCHFVKHGRDEGAAPHPAPTTTSLT
jgi:hypothetical protein